MCILPACCVFWADTSAAGDTVHLGAERIVPTGRERLRSCFPRSCILVLAKDCARNQGLRHGLGAGALLGIGF